MCSPDHWGGHFGFNVAKDHVPQLTVTAVVPPSSLYLSWEKNKKWISLPGSFSVFWSKWVTHSKIPKCWPVFCLKILTRKAHKKCLRLVAKRRGVTTKVSSSIWYNNVFQKNASQVLQKVVSQAVQGDLEASSIWCSVPKELQRDKEDLVQCLTQIGQCFPGDQSNRFKNCQSFSSWWLPSSSFSSSSSLPSLCSEWASWV